MSSSRHGQRLVQGPTLDRVMWCIPLAGIFISFPPPDLFHETPPLLSFRLPMLCTQLLVSLDYHCSLPKLA